MHLNLSHAVHDPSRHSNGAVTVDTGALRKSSMRAPDPIRQPASTRLHVQIADVPSQALGIGDDVALRDSAACALLWGRFEASLVAHRFSWHRSVC